MIPERRIFRPPTVAQTLLWLLLPAHYREQFLGDLQEEFDERATQDRTSARRWYRREVLRSRPLALRRQLATEPSPRLPTKGWKESEHHGHPAQ